MSTAEFPPALPLPPFPTDWKVANLQDHLGGLSLERIRLYPPPGLATEADALRINDRKEALCELVDGTLVEKVVSTFESYVAATIIYLITDYLQSNPIGIVTAGDGELWILPNRMRIPDVAFISWVRFPGGELPKDRVYKVAPDLAVEILSPGNTRREMELKLDDYFQAGVRLVWYVDPATRTAEIYTARDAVRTIDESGDLDCGEVLPGLSINLGDLFRRVERRAGP